MFDAVNWDGFWFFSWYNLNIRYVVTFLLDAERLGSRSKTLFVNEKTLFGDEK